MNKEQENICKILGAIAAIIAKLIFGIIKVIVKTIIFYFTLI